ncbi:MAG TPA: hypothetical protein VHM70_30170 [Polyangiaceae bacterium]|nr:hypothetical protein [Polyangiaceae bacterium]
MNSEPPPHSTLVPSPRRPGATPVAGREAFERVLWLGFDRTTLLGDARWLRHATALHASVCTSVGQVLDVCRGGDPLAVIVDFELGRGENGVRALEQLRELGLLAPSVLITHTPELALAALERSRLLEAVPVFSRTERHAALREWLSDLQTCLSIPA